MKKLNLNGLRRAMLAFLILLATGQAIAQTNYSCELKNITNPTPETVEFDIWLANTGTTVLTFQSVACGLEFNYNGMANGGTITGSWVSGSSAAMNAPQNNLASNASIHATTKQFRITAKIQTDKASANILTSTPIKYGTFRLTNTVPFTANSTPNFIWSFITSSNRTKSLMTCWVDAATTAVNVTTQTTGGTPNVQNLTAPYNYIAGPQHFVENNPTINAGSCPTSAAASNIVDPVCFGGTGSADITLTPTAPGGTYTIDGGANAIPFTANPFNVAGLSQGQHTISVTATGCTTPVDAVVIIGGPTSNPTNSTTATACDTYTWSVNGQTYTTSGTYTGTSVNGSGCTVNETLNLTINASTTNTSSATACDTYTWSVNGTTYTQSGTYTVTSTNTAGCLHTETLNLTINASSSNTTATSACDTYTWAANGQTYTTSGTYTATSTNAAGCLHTETLNLTINASTTNSTSATACDTYTWAANGATYTTSGTYTATSTNTAGCLHTETLNLTINASTTNTTSASACNTYTWSVNGQTYTTSGTYTATSTNTAGCLHTETLNLTINAPTSNTTSATACDTYTWSVNGQTYTASGTYTATSTNTAGCLHTETLNLTINASTTNSTSATACDTYTWSVNGQTYTASGTYTATSTNSAGCLHTETLNLTINASTTNTSSATACDTYTWSVNGQTYTASGTYTATSTNTAGCLHTETLNLTINASTSNTTTATACGTYTWSANGQTYTASGTYTATSTNSAGCLHTETLNLTITSYSTNTTTATACNTYTWSANGQTYLASGTYTLINGCVVEELVLTINTGTTNTTTATACNSYTWSVNGQTYTTSGTYSVVNGCNSEVLNLTISTTGTITTNASVCGSYTWSVNGQTYNTSGTYTTVIGCTNYVLNLTISPVPGQVTGLNATNITGISANVNWGAIAGIGWYEIRFKPSASSTWNPSQTNNGATTKILGGLQPNTCYDVEVRAFCNLSSPGPWSTTYQFCTNNSCNVPVGLSATYTATTATMSWTPVPGATFYTIQYKLATASAWITSTSATPSKTVNIANGTYVFQVKAHCGSTVAVTAYSAPFTFTKGNASKEVEAPVVASLEGAINIYPNPTSSDLNIEFDVNEITETVVKVMDMSGRVVKQTITNAEIGTNKLTLSLGDLSNGIYTVQIIGNDKLIHVARVSKN